MSSSEPPGYDAPNAPNAPHAYGAPAGAGAGAYGQPYGQPYGDHVDPPKRNGLGTAALVLGILALLSFWTVLGGIIFGLAAIVLGFIGRSRAKRGEASNGGMALAGAILGIVAVLLTAGVVALGASLLNSEVAKDFEQCVDKANGSRPQIEACEREFKQKLQDR
jgi:hypothetical protein